MGTISGCSEILESTESNSKSKMNAHAGKHHMLKPGQICSIEDDINKLFEAIDSKIFGRSLGLTDQVSKDKLRKKAMKRPMTPGSSSGIGFSDSVSLKQAFRGLSISQASEMAAIKRLSKPTNLSRTSNSVTKEKLYRAVVDESTESSFPTGGNENMVEISLVPEESTSNFSEKTKSFSNLDFRHRNRSVLSKVDARSKSREKGEFSQSSKSSIGEYSSSTSTSDESTLSGHRPHMSKDLRWEVIRRFRKQNGSLGLRHFKLIKKLGGGDIGTVYLAELMGTHCLFALKIMEHEFLASKKKMSRAETEREILQMLDHPFLPTLFAHFTTDKYSVLVVDFCPGGDLHVLRQKQPNKSFPELAARFYIAEVLLSLEYLHMLGVVYRDLKPENVLVREDGHIMLLDFDLSLRCTVSPTLLKTSPLVDSPKRESNPCSDSSCIHPLCLQPSWQVPCFTPRLLSGSTRKRKLKADLATQVIPLPQLIAEPTTARSNSFVGTHEYLAPEIIKGEGHGSAVDWWTLGIFMYELVYGRTPFKGPKNEETLSNIVSHSIEFPSRPFVSAHARDLIRGLLTKDPKNRFGCVKGAVEIKQHPFFEGINWALIRCTVPPGHDKRCESENVNADVSAQNSEGVTSQEVTGEHFQFEMF